MVVCSFSLSFGVLLIAAPILLQSSFLLFFLLLLFVFEVLGFGLLVLKG